MCVCLQSLQSQMIRRQLTTLSHRLHEAVHMMDATSSLAKLDKDRDHLYKSIASKIKQERKAINDRIEQLNKKTVRHVSFFHARNCVCLAPLFHLPFQPSLPLSYTFHVQDQQEEVEEKVVEDLKRKANDAEEVSKEKEEKRMKEETEKRELDRAARQKAQIEKTQVRPFFKP
jgi:hypothetical protein